MRYIKTTIASEGNQKNDMVKNVKGGKYAKKQKNKGAVRERAEQPEPVEEQCWAMVMKMLGQCRLTLLLPTGEQTMGVIRGSMRKRVYIRPGDLVLATARATAEETHDVVFKYDEAYIAALRKAEPKLPFWKAAYQLHASGGAGAEEEDEDELVNFEEAAESSGSESDNADTSEDDEGTESGTDDDELDIDAI